MIYSGVQTGNSLKEAQWPQLQKQLSYVMASSAYYRNRLKAEGYTLDLDHPDKLSLLPFTTKEDLSAHNQEFLAVPMKEVVEIVVTSGTTGTPVPFYLTAKDIARLADNEYQSLSIAGVTESDIVQLTTTLDKMFVAGLAYSLGIHKIGAIAIRVGPGQPEWQWNTILSMKSTVLIAVPSFVLKLLSYAHAKGIDPNATSVKKIICIGEPIRNKDFSLNTLAQRIVSQWNVKLFSTYASTEMCTAFTECEAGQGGHLLPSLIVAEVLDENNNPVASGESGELVITTLENEGMPLVRFRTGDICSYHEEPCSCGRHTPRLGPIMGRRQQMIKYKGTTFYPSAINEILNGIKEVNTYYTEVYHNEFGLDEVSVTVACAHASEEIKKLIRDRFKALLRVAPEIVFDSADKIDQVRNTGNLRKPIDFLDKRNV